MKFIFVLEAGSYFKYSMIGAGKLLPAILLKYTAAVIPN
jgi:hypothetical protein